MSIQAVSNLSIYQELQNFYQDRRADVRQLGHALQSGDLNQAQEVYEALSALGQTGPFGNAGPFSKANRSQAFAAVGQALQSGNLEDAQAAFANLQQTFGNSSRTGFRLPAFTVNLSRAQNSAGAQGTAADETIRQDRLEFFQQRKTVLEQLGSALQAGDADAAQQSYDALVALGQNGPLRNGATFRRSDRAQDFAAIGEALQSGNLEGAQQAFTELANTFGHRGTYLGPPALVPPPEVAPPTSNPPPDTLPPGPPTLLPPPTISPSAGAGHHLPPWANGGPSGPPEIIVNVGGSTVPAGSTAEIVVNLQPSNTPEEIQINFGDGHGSVGHLSIGVSQQSENGGEQVAINFNPGRTNYQLVLNLFGLGASDSSQSNLSLQA